MRLLTNIPRPVAIFAVNKLAEVDYNIATKVSETVSELVNYSYSHDQIWISHFAINFLQTLDNLGSLLISFVVWIVCNTH